MIYPEINPIAIQFGSIAIGWYGLMYLFGFSGAWLMGRWQCKKSFSKWNQIMVDDAVFYMALGVILGGRLGYVLFYNLDYYLQSPLSIFKVWQGGMSFHGGLIGVIVAMFLFAKKYKVSVFVIADFVAPCVTPGLFFGRIGNFINSELWGKITDSNLGMLMQDPVYGLVKRYPTQLLEALLEGLVLGLILWFASRKWRPPMFISGLFLTFYGLFRMFVELFRVPDAHIGYLAGNWLTMGQILSIPMVLIGIIFISLAYLKKQTTK